MIRLAAAENTLPGDSLEEKYRVVLNCGFDGIELSAPGAGGFTARREELSRARDVGVQMPSAVWHGVEFFGSFDPEQRRAAVDGAKDAMPVLAAAGARGLVCPNSFGVFSLRLPPFTPPRPAQQSRQMLVEALREVGQVAAENGVKVFLEPLNRFEDYLVTTLEGACSIAEEVSSPGVAVVADTFHASIEEADVEASLRTAAPWLEHVQLGDTNRLEPGAGHYDWESTLQVLDEIGYDGWLAMECGLSGPVTEVLPSVARLLRSRS